MEPEDDKPVGERYEIPRQSFWATVPKRSFVRVVVLLVALLGILYLRQQTSSIAGWTSFAKATTGRRRACSSPPRTRTTLHWKRVGRRSRPYKPISFQVERL